MNDQMKKAVDIFNQVQLGYLVIESRQLKAWQKFLVQGIGLHLEAVEEGLLAFRVDEHARRLIVREGDAEDVVAFGWHLQNDEAKAVVLDRLRQHGISISTGSASEAAQRGVQSFQRIKGPKEIDFEFYTQPILATTPLNMLASGFVTGDGGVGHAAIISRHPERMQHFFETILDARASDRITQVIAGVTLDFTFLRVNERHHSVAVAASRGIRLDPVRTRIQHMNLILNTLDDLSAAYKRLREQGYEIAREIGQHPNDKDMSFYVVSPSGFEVEVGWGALKVDEQHWQPNNHYNSISLWGHKPSNTSRLHFLRTNANSLRQGLLSLRKPEYSPI